MECSIDPLDSARIQAASEVNRRWGEYMKDILYYAEGTDGPTELTQVFLHPWDSTENADADVLCIFLHSAYRMVLKYLQTKEKSGEFSGK